MTTGSQADFINRLTTLLPPWFGNGPTPVLDGVLTAPASVDAQIYSLIQYITLQTRTKTSTGGFLDLSSYDYFGDSLPRNPGESDAAYLARILAALFPKRNTIPALQAAITNLGLSYQIIEPWNPGEASAYNQNAWKNVAGYCGSRSLPGQLFLIVTNPSGSGVTAAQIYAAAEAVRPAGTIIWVAIIV